MDCRRTISPDLPGNSKSTRSGEKKASSEERRLARERSFTAQVNRQRGLCFFCNEELGGDCTREHLHARANGGDNSAANLKAAHSDCNGAVGHLPVRVKLLLRAFGHQHGREAFLERSRRVRRAEVRRTFKLVGDTVRIRKEPGPNYWRALGFADGEKPEWWDG